MTMVWPLLLDKLCSASLASNRRLRCHSIFRRPRFSGASGLICNQLPLEKRDHIAKWQKPSDILRRSVQLRGHVRLIPWQLRSRATACCALMAILADIDGAWSARRRFSKWNRLADEDCASNREVLLPRSSAFDNSLPTLIPRRD